MSKAQKRIAEFCTLPKQYTYQKLHTLLYQLGYQLRPTSKGSQVVYIHLHSHHIIRLHRPHPHPYLKTYQMTAIYHALKEQQLIP